MLLFSFHCRPKATLCSSLNQNNLRAAPLQPWGKVGAFSWSAPTFYPPESNPWIPWQLLDSEEGSTFSFTYMHGYVQTCCLEANTT